ncbi:MAG: D-glycero-beta-D-manno-heptose-1,7-bisphosphate 7-phosphatase [Gammaproteobacteria bacterium]|nr:MAG: D-glycero-beta-D-manno-heptose-1,7-bisphosphate 7-phosphatase [Gammaproteobacteria bacterium]RLA23692.1 MAG: D-glycero-beta-D-manno-heptose-1,7-bisphosphate 7-phosphatase [Gammaproteobacteria bacterium]
MKYIILDRDGVINQDSDAYIKSPEEWIPVEGSLEAIELLNQHDFHVVVATNQSGLARGLYDEPTLYQIHAKMQRMVAEKGGRISAIFYCPHGPDDGCDCRKPEPGLLLQFAERAKISLEGIPFVGDTLRDIQAAQAVGASPFLVKTGKGEKTLQDNPNLDVPVFDNLLEAAKEIIRHAQN